MTTTQARNRQSGSAFESLLKSRLIEAGLDAWNLGYNERADILVVNGKDRIIECKTTHGETYRLSKNAKQHQRLVQYAAEHTETSVYYAVKHIIAHKSFIKFYFLPQITGKYLNVHDKNSYTLIEFIEHCNAVRREHA